jgi:antitoxin (DNA-binding transcriptional repressor) of toxin-antitoxin stability system
MKTITVRELHMNTGRYVRKAVEGDLVVTDRGLAVASLSRFTGYVKGTPLPDRESFILKLPRIQADSAKMVAEDRSGR